MLRHVLAGAVGLLIGAWLVYYLSGAASFGPNGSSNGRADLPADLWVAFVTASGLLAFVVYRFLSPRR